MFKQPISKSYDIMAFPLSAMMPGKMNAITGTQEVSMHIQGGMTLRDYFAAKAMSALITRLDNVRPFPSEPIDKTLSRVFDDVSKDAYSVADKMLMARDGGSMTSDKG